MGDAASENYRFSSAQEVETFLEREKFDKAFIHDEIGEYLKDPLERTAVVIKGPRDCYILTIFQSEEAMLMDLDVRKALL